MKATLFLAGAAMIMLGAHAIARDPADPAAMQAISARATPAMPAGDPEKVLAARQVVQEGWAKYDKGNKGALTPLEFGTWVMAAQGQDVNARTTARGGKVSRPSAARVLNATAAAFAKADANHDHLISPDELTAFLGA